VGGPGSACLWYAIPAPPMRRGSTVGTRERETNWRGFPVVSDSRQEARWRRALRAGPGRQPPGPNWRSSPEGTPGDKFYIVLSASAGSRRRATPPPTSGYRRGLGGDRACLRRPAPQTASSRPSRRAWLPAYRAKDELRQADGKNVPRSSQALEAGQAEAQGRSGLAAALSPNGPGPCSTSRRYGVRRR